MEKQRDRIRFHGRLLGRLLVFGLVPMVVVLAAIVGVNAYRSLDRFRQTVTSDVQDATALAVAEVDAENQTVAALARSIGQAQIEGGMFGERTQTLAFLRAVLEANPDIQGTYVGYEPNADGLDAKPDSNVQSLALSPAGRFIPYWRRDRDAIGGIRLEPLAGMEEYPEFLFYLGPKLQWERSGRPDVLFTKPYEYEGVHLIEQVYPLVRDGVFVGIAGVDRSLEHIQRTLERIGAEIGADCFLITTSIDGVTRYIASTTDRDAPPGDRLQSRPVAGSPLESLFANPPRSSGRASVRESIDPVLGEHCYYGVATLPNAGWLLVVRRPSATIYANLTSLLVQNGVTALVGALVIAAIFYFVARRFSARLTIATEAASRIAEGDLTQSVQRVPDRDETGILLDSFATMNENLARMAANLRRASIQINSTATEIGATALQQEEMANGFSASATEVAAATKEISTTGAELARTMDAIAQSSQGAARQAGEGRDSVTAMQDAMRRLDDAADSVTAKLGAISEKAQGIAAILGTITKIAEQANLLSVNAAIEAEKAGELGLGFLVVAREIRRLADQTSEATLDIDRVIRQMQGAVSGGVMEMDRFGETLRSCVEEGDAVSRRLEGIVGHVERDTLRIGQVTEGMRAQAAGVHQIDDAMRSLSAAARQSSSSASEFAQAAAGMRESIAYLKEAVESFRVRE